MSCRFFPRIGVLLFFSLFLSLLTGEVRGGDKNPGDWAGAHLRLSWVQDQGKGSDTLARGSDLMLMGYDSKDGRGERALVNRKGNFFKPLITPDGKTVIVSDRNARRIYRVDWDSGKLEKIGSGVAVALWQDPEPGSIFRKKPVWVYCFDGLQPENKYGTSQPLYRFPLGKPKKKELIWKKTNLAWSNIQLSRDGEILGGLFPWPHGGILSLKEQSFTRFGRGCWTSLCPDNSRLLWIFDGGHRNLQIYDTSSTNSWKVQINKAPGINGFEVYHPRWSNHPRYFVMTGPYEKGEGGNRIGGGGEKVEIHIGRFSEDLRNVEGWFQATRNGKADFYPELWLESGNTASLDRRLFAAGKKIRKVDAWPAGRDNLVFVWKNMKAANQLSENSPVGFFQCNLELRGNAIFNHNLQFSGNGGWAQSGEAGVKIASALAGTKEMSLEFVLTPDQNQQGTLFSFAAEKGGGLFVSQVQDGLRVALAANNGAEGREQGVGWEKILQSNTPRHLVLTFIGDRVELFADGNSMGARNLSVDWSLLKMDRLELGDRLRAWYGFLENIAVYNKQLGIPEIRQNSEFAAAAYSGRGYPQTLIMEATLSETTEIPAPESIGAYSRALVVNSYQVDRMVYGEYGEDTIVVAEWAVLDRRIIRSYPENPASERLVLQKFDDHPELEGERQMMDIFEPDLDMYYRLP